LLFFIFFTQNGDDHCDRNLASISLKWMTQQIKKILISFALHTEKNTRQNSKMYLKQGWHHRWGLGARAPPLFGGLIT